MSDLVAALRSSSLFSDLEAEDLKRIAEHVVTIDVPADKLLFAEGAASDSVYFIETGEVRIGKGAAAPPSRFARFLATLGPGQVFGELSLLLDEPRTAAALVTRPARLHRLDRVDFNRFLESRDELAWRLLQALLRQASERLRDAVTTVKREQVGPADAAAMTDSFLQLGWR